MWESLTKSKNLTFRKKIQVHPFLRRKSSYGEKLMPMGQNYSKKYKIIIFRKNDLPRTNDKRSIYVFLKK